MLLGIGVLVVRAVLGNATNEVQLNIQVPDVGECITQASTVGTETEVVACDSTEAAWRVIGNAGSLTESGFAATAPEEVCAAFPDTEYALWIGEVTTDQSGDGEVVCLVQVVAGT